jgi:hypothetical protein
MDPVEMMRGTDGRAVVALVAAATGAEADVMVVEIAARAASRDRATPAVASAGRRAFRHRHDHLVRTHRSLLRRGAGTSSDKGACRPRAEGTSTRRQCMPSARRAMQLPLGRRRRRVRNARSTCAVREDTVKTRSRARRRPIHRLGRGGVASPRNQSSALRRPAPPGRPARDHCRDAA